MRRPTGTRAPLLYTSLTILIAVLVNQTTATSPTYAPFGGQPNSVLLPTLFPRQNTCTDSPSSTSCNVGSFCCPNDTRCIPVENNSSVVCCKKGEFCDEIFPINCASSSGGNNGNSDDSNDNVQCGTQCCPTGYECGGSSDRCVLKPENLPPDHKDNRDMKRIQNNSAMQQSCRDFLGVAEDGTCSTKKYGKFTFEGILVGLFPGIAIGVAIMFAYTKTVEMKSRRRTIKFNGRLSASPDDLSYMDQKRQSIPPPLPQTRQPPSLQGNIAIGYSPTIEHAPTPSTFQRDWQRTPADYSPNLGPIIPPRGGSPQENRNSERLTPSRLALTPTRSPSPMLLSLSTAPLKPRPPMRPDHRISSDSETSATETSRSATSQNVRGVYHRHLASDVRSLISDDEDEDGFSEVVIMDGTGHQQRHGQGHAGLSQREGRSRHRLSTATGYTESVYLEPGTPDGRYERERDREREREPELPPLNFRDSSPMGGGYSGRF